MPAALISVGNLSVVEGNSGTLNAAVPVTISQPHGNSVTVNYSTANGTALAGSDYNAVSGTLTFNKNETTKSILVPIRGDRIVEATESFSVRLANAKGAQIARGQGFVTIVDNEPHASINDATLIEGDSGTATMSFTVSLQAAYDAPVTINYATADGTATSGSDYSAASGSVTFQPGQTQQTIAIAVKGDRLAEPDETFSVQLTTLGNSVTLDRSVAQGTILDNEPRVSIDDPSLLEGDSGTTTMTFNVTLQAPYDVPVTIHYDTADGTATAGSDYAAASGTVTFTPGETLKTIAIAVNGDRLLEDDETVLVNITTPDSSAAIVKGQGIGVIYDNEPHISIFDASQDYYASTITFTVVLAVPYDQPVTVDFTTVDGSAYAGVDYVATSGTLTFNPGDTVATFTVELLATDPSPYKYFSIQLSNASPNAMLVNDWANGYWYYDYGSGW